MRPCLVRGREPCLVCQEDMELERTIQELQEKRRILRTRMNASHDPFNFKFPPEIASLIFSLSLEKDDYEPGRSTLRKLPTPFLLGSISRSWRQLARSTPQLWSTIAFTLVRKKTDALPPLQFINDWLQLSGSLPLTLWIFKDTRTKVGWKTFCPPVVDAINQHSGRWHKVVFHLDIRYLRYFRGTDFPSNLYDLEIINQEGWDMYDSPPAHFSMISRPSPVRLTIDDLLLSGIDVAWSNVTCLTMRRIPARECVKALKLVPLLESCTLSHLDNRPIEDDDDDDLWAPLMSPQPIFRYNRLRKLFLTHPEADPLLGFINMVEFPSLEELSYKLTYDIGKKGLILLLKRSGNHLKWLTLLIDDDPKQTLDDLTALLRAVPNLQNLQCELLLESSFFSSDMYSIVDIVKVLSRIPELLFNLQSLVIYSHCTLTDDIWEYIPKIFSQSHRKLLTLKLEATGWVNMFEHDLDTALQLVDEGFDIRIFERGQDYLQKIRAERASLANPPT
jgi:hypothetical protein